MSLPVYVITNNGYNLKQQPGIFTRAISFIVENLTKLKHREFWILVKTATLQRATPKTATKFVATKTATTKGQQALC